MIRDQTILVADSDEIVAACMAEALITEGYTVHCYPCDRLTVDVIERVRPDLVIIEQPHAERDVTPLLDQLRQHATLRAIAVIVSMTDPRMARALAAPLQRRNCATLLKPFELDQLFDSVARALAGSQRVRCTRGPEWRYA